MNITPKELKSILDRHAKWLDDAEGGERANLSEADLSAGDNMNNELIKAAQAVVDRWDSTDWKAAPTAEVMNRLRAALSAKPEPCCGEYSTCLRACTPRGKWLQAQEPTKLPEETK